MGNLSMRSIHRPFNVFLCVGELIGRNILFVSEATPDFRRYLGFWPFTILKGTLIQSLRRLYIVWVAGSGSKIDAIVIFEHNVKGSFLLYLMCVCRRVPVFFFVHGLQQSHDKTVLHRLGFGLLRFVEKHFSFWPIHLEVNDGVIVDSLRFTKSITIPHPQPPLAKEFVRGNASGKIRLGVVGIARSDKPISALIDRLISFAESRDDVEIVLGMPERQYSGELRNKSLTHVDTSSPLQYFKLLSTIDIVVTAFDRERFHFRPSGVINDAIAAGCYVVAPDCIVFSAQVNTPVAVGLTYRDDTEIIATVEKAILSVRVGGIDFESWRSYRRNGKWVPYLAAKIEQVIAAGK